MRHSQHIYYFFPLRQKNVLSCLKDFLLHASCLPPLEIIHPLTYDFGSKVWLSVDVLDLHSLFDASFIFQTLFSGFHW